MEGLFSTGPIPSSFYWNVFNFKIFLGASPCKRFLGQTDGWVQRDKMTFQKRTGRLTIARALGLRSQVVIELVKK